MTARFEIVHTDHKQPWHARWVADNGEIVWWTETYVDKRDAEASILMIAGARTEDGRITATLEPGYPVHYIDERTPDDPGLNPLF